MAKSTPAAAPKAAEEAKKERIYLNGISRKFVHEREVEKEDGTKDKFYSVGIPVPETVSDNGFAHVTTKRLLDNKFDPEGKVNLMFYNDKDRQVVVQKGTDEEGKPKFEKVQMKPSELRDEYDAQKEAFKESLPEDQRYSAKAKEAAAEAEAPEAEEEGPDFD